MNIFDETINKIFSYTDSDKLEKFSLNDNYNLFWKESINKLENAGYKQLSYNEVIDKVRSSDYLLKYKEQINEINYDLLKKGNIHGINHIIRSSFYALLICIYEQINFAYLNIIFDCIFYHDIGRVNDIDDENHGLNAINKISFLNGKYNDDDFNIIKFVIACHCLEDDKYGNMLNMFNIKNKELSLKILYLIKDADALDRVREYPYLDINYLRLNSSKKLVNFSYELFIKFKMNGSD